MHPLWHRHVWMALGRRSAGGLRRTTAPGTRQTLSRFQLRQHERTFIWSAVFPGLLRLVGCLPRRNGAAARAAGVRQASKEETAEHRADAADVMGIVASASGVERPSLSRSGMGELAVKAAASPADGILGVPTAQMGMLIFPRLSGHRVSSLSARPVRE